MARIRAIKPEFFRHEGLQDLEAANPGFYVMLVFAALWGHCDKNGVFPYNPRTLKLDILPFLDFDLGASLVLLGENGLIFKFESGGKQYGYIPTFADHQRVAGKEAQEPPKYPEPKDFLGREETETNGEASGKRRGSSRDDRKGRESNIPPPIVPPQGDAPRSESRKRGCRLSEDWKPSDEDRAYATGRGHSQKQIDDMAEQFRDHWRAKAGQGATKLDWAATWRTWVRNDEKFNGPPGSRRAQGDATPRDPDESRRISQTINRLVDAGYGEAEVQALKPWMLGPGDVEKLVLAKQEDIDLTNIPTSFRRRTV